MESAEFRVKIWSVRLADTFLYGAMIFIAIIPLVVATIKRRGQDPSLHYESVIFALPLGCTGGIYAAPTEYPVFSRWRWRPLYPFFAKISSRVWDKTAISMGLATCAFMPAAKAFLRSSSKALAVIATMGMFALRGLSMARIARVAV